MKIKFLVGAFLFIFLISFISADCELREDGEDLKVDIGIYDKIRTEEGVVFKESTLQPEEGGIVQKGDVLLIESFYLKHKKNSCDDFENFLKLSLGYSPQNISQSIEIPLSFVEEGDYLIYNFKIDELQTGKTTAILPYTTNNPEKNISLKYLNLDEEGEFEVLISWNINHFWKISNENSNIRYLNVLNRVDVAQLETLEQLKEDSNESATHAIKVAWGAIRVAISIGLATILFMWLFHKREEKREIKREEEKQIDLLKTLLTELIFLEGNLKSYKETFSRQNVYPFYELWDIDVSLYLKNLSHKVQNKETISLKKELMVIKDKLFIINNIKIETKKLEEERGQERIIKDLGLIKINRDQIIKIIDGDVLPVLKKSKKFIEENFGIKSKK